jgi:hypothetical protein
MMIEQEDVIGLQDVPELLPEAAPGKRVHRVTVHRWVTKGVRGVRLETTRIGGRRRTSRQAVRRFLDRLNAQDGQPEPVELSCDRKREQHAKANALAAAGL